MQPEEKKCYIKLLKFLNKYHTDKEIKEIVHIIDQNGVQRICRCLSNIIYQEDIGIKKDKNKTKKLKKLIKKHKEEVQNIIKYSPKKTIVEEKRKILTGKGFPLAAILGTAIPMLINYITKH